MVNSTKIGQIGEQVAEVALVNAGFNRIKKIETGWKVLRWINIKKRIAVVIPFKSVQGDFTAVTPSGKHCLIEVKTTRNNRNLRLSDFEKHQIIELNDNAKVALSFVVYVFDQFPGYAILRWPINIKKGKGLSPNDAVKSSITDIYDL